MEAKSHAFSPRNVDKTDQHEETPISDLEDNLIVCLYADLNTDDLQNLVSVFKEVVNHIHTFNNPDLCVDYITDLRDKRVLLILFRDNLEQIFPLAELLPNVNSIYIFGSDEASISDSRKLKGAFPNVFPLLKALANDLYRSENGSLKFQILEGDNLTSASIQDKTNKQEGLFMYSQLLKEIFLQMKHDDSTEEMIRMLRTEYANNKTQLQFLDEFERDYESSQAIRWYTRDGPPYKVVNKALRTQNIDILYKMRTFLRHVHEQLMECYQMQVSTKSSATITVYRGQQMSKIEFQKMKQNEGALFSISNFLSTTENKELAIAFAGVSDSHNQAVLMIIEASYNKSTSTTPFASIGTLSHFGEAEKEWLFSMGAVFRIRRVEPLSNDIWCIYLKMTDENDKQLSVLTDYLRKTIQLGDIDSKLSLAALLGEVAQHSKAKEFYQMKLESEADWANRALILMNIGVTLARLYNHEEALDYYRQAIEVYCQDGRMADDDHIFDQIYGNMGITYRQIGNLELALQYFRRSLNLMLTKNREHCDELTIFRAFDNISNVLQEQGLYSESLKNYEQLLDVLKKTLPTKHPYIARVQKRMAWISIEQEHFDEAKQLIKMSLDIQLDSLPEDHTDIASTYNTLGTIALNQEHLEDAIQYFCHALTIFLKHYSSDHPMLSPIYNNIGTVCIKRKDYEQAFSYISKALEIDTNRLSADHFDLAPTYTNMCLVLIDLKKYNEALLYCQRAIQIRTKHLPLQHPSFILLYDKLAFLQFKLNAFEEALQSSKRSLDINLAVFGPHHPKSIDAYMRLWTFTARTGRFEEALRGAMKTLENSIEIFGMAHPISRKCQETIEFICSKM